MKKLNPDQIRFLKEEGCLAVKGVLDPVKDPDPIVEEYNGVLNRLASDLYAKGIVSSKQLKVRSPSYPDPQPIPTNPSP